MELGHISQVTNFCHNFGEVAVIQKFSKFKRVLYGAAMLGYMTRKPKVGNNSTNMTELYPFLESKKVVSAIKEILW